jgi:hypothetical protein
MEIQEALAIIRKLADGMNPDTGEVLHTDSLYRNPSAVRALNRAAGALEFQYQRENARRFLPSNAGKPWSNQEDAEICDEIRRGLGFADIAKNHNRTVGSIVARLVRLGTIGAAPQSRRTA